MNKSTGGINSRQPRMRKMTDNGSMNLTHLSYGMLPIARTPMVTPLVGKILVNSPSPNWNANTAVWRVIPIRSARGAIRGMVRAAWPEPDGTKKFIKPWKANII